MPGSHIAKTSGLVQAMEVLRNVEGIATMRFSQADVVRHPLVQSIILAYERSATRERERNGVDPADKPRGE